MPDPLAGHVALVTGAARPRGIGRATALRLARDGADVACLDIARPDPAFPSHAVADEDDLADVVREIEALGRRSVGVGADVSDAAAVAAALADARAALGPIDVCVNVAGGAGLGMGLGPLVTLGEDEWDRVLAINLKGTWLVARACAQAMIADGRGGRIVNTSSQAGKRGFPMLGAYCAAKAGVILLTQVLASELGAHAITVNAVCPGTVDTDLLNPNGAFVQMIEVLEGSGGFDRWLAREIPLGRLETAEDVAAVIAFLCGPDSAYVTGEAVNVSGGQTMV